MFDIDKVREDFPITQKMVYLDNGAKSAQATSVRAALESYLDLWSEKGSDYPYWWTQVDYARKKLADLISANKEEIAFASSCTHAVNIVAEGLDLQPGDNIVVAADEFPSNLYPWLGLREKGVEIRLATSEDGKLPLERYLTHVDEKTRLLAVSHVQYATGYRCNLEEFSVFCKQRNIRFLVDATQSLGIVPINTKKYSIDYLVASTYKWLLGTDGLAVLYIAQNALNSLRFSYTGWSGRTEPNDYTHYRLEYPQEARRFELGNLNYSAITALNAGVDYLDSIGIVDAMRAAKERVFQFKRYLKSQPKVHLCSNFDDENTGPLITFAVQGRPHKEVHTFLLEQGFKCALRSNGIRVSPSFYTTSEEIDGLCSSITEYIQNIDL